MIQLFLSWVHAKFEYIVATICGVSAMTLDIPQLILKVVMAIILGGAGAFGGWLVKLLLAKIKKVK